MSRLVVTRVWLRSAGATVRR